ncbi:P-loop containing nucleoside triphosphate hydrolase protein [Helicostylum pulchrum]|nr:P-loop containing nucleoside triphosphate hydrolase protein [Helicostylum pulchrum]
MSTDGLITPPPTPVGNQSQQRTAYPSPTSSSSKSSSTTKPSNTRPTLKPSFSTKSTSIRENVQVMVRCRPRSKKELQIDEEPCWLISPEEGSIELARLKAPSTISTFHYDNVVMGVDNEQVYKAGILDLVRSAMMGYNGTVFAYGQTASGKTYSTENEPGVIPRAVQEVFSYIEEDTTGREYLLRVSYMEIYNEKIKDLLNTQNTDPEIVEDKKGVYVRNLKEVIVKTAQEVMNCIKEGEGNRHISATDYNEHSSRSHTVFQFVIESRSKGVPANTNRGVRVSQLNLIDLAGSEKVATDIERRKEGGYINKSLLTLGNVISKLTSDEPATHIPFRNSKLTRILQVALSGNARISVICTINPTFASKDESLNTLRFAQRAKLVKTAAKMTRILDNSELQNCLIKIAELQTKMQEKTDLEAETRQRLKSLLGLILTSSKEDHPDQLEMFKQFSNISADDLMKESTMRDVVARCEEGFSAQITTHQKQMDKMAQDVESMRDMVNIMESAHAKQTDALSKRDAQIEKLKQELSSSKSSRTTKMPISRQTKTPRSSLHPAFIPTMESTKVPMSKVPELQEHVHIPQPPPPPPPPKIELPKKPVLSDTKLTQPTVTLQDFNPAISLAVKHISEAISTGLTHSPSPQEQDDDEVEYDMMTSCLEPPNQSIVDISDAISRVFKAVISSTVLNQEQKVDDSKQTITQALKNAIQHSTVKNFIPIHEAVAFIQVAPLTEFVNPSQLVPVNEEPLIAEDLSELVVTDDELPELEEEIVQELSVLECPAEEHMVQELSALERSAAEEELLEYTAEKKMTEEELATTEKKMVQELPTAEKEKAIISEQDLSRQNQICNEESDSFIEEAYSHSINQSSTLSFIFNKWTVMCFAVYIFFQTN